jgi:hypothetical protein
MQAPERARATKPNNLLALPSRTVATTVAAGASLRYERQPLDVPLGAFHLLIYLTTSSSFAPSLPKNTRKRNTARSDSIRSKGFEKDLGWGFGSFVYPSVA